MKWEMSRFWQNREMWLVAALLVILLGVLLSPTIKSLETVEVDPDNTGIYLNTGESLSNVMIMPEGLVSYLVVFVKEERGVVGVARQDYENLKLVIQDEAGEVLREVGSPRFIKREDLPALSFHFEEIAGRAGELVQLTLEQGAGSLRIEKPFLVHVDEGEGERAEMAVQLGAERNWITLLTETIYAEKFVGNDISFYHHRGKQIAKGVNPYDCIKDTEEECVGYPAHIPGMYLVASGFVQVGVDEAEEWERAWRPVNIFFWLAVGVLLLAYLWKQGKPALGVAAMGFWLFNRWALQVLRIAHVDFIGVLFLLLSVLLVTRWPLLAALLLGVSLSVKQVAVLIVPLFLIYLWRQEKLSWKRMLGAVGLIVLVPLLVTLPFLIDNFAATSRGVMDIILRPAQVVHGFAPSLDAFLDVGHSFKSLFMWLLSGFVYVAAWRKKVDLVAGSLMIFAIIMAFTPVLFNQYFVWFLPFIPLALVRIDIEDRG